ncbi:MAG: tRNA (adenosine(37)-N6)-threonylcarbamoyltransferase complex ATPase subunit type 1 TsaE [Planctomycetota bacterium]|jgi:tRNA threonylcarbamoyladenosine biosynthesis protein TsaE
MSPEVVPVIDLTTTGEEETRAVARRLAGAVRGGDVIALSGPLGAGKTCFVRGLAEGLGYDARDVASPTFIVCRELRPPAGSSAPRLLHLDGYRLGGADELETIGWDEMLAAGDAVIAVEWPERFGDELPARRITVELAHVDERRRHLRISAPPDLAERLARRDRRDEREPGACPVCRKPASRSAATYPFCSDRCRLVDLGRWLGESYRIVRPLAAEDLEAGE